MMDDATYALLVKAHAVLDPRRRWRFVDEGARVPATLRGGLNRDEWANATRAQRALILDHEAPLGSDPYVILDKIKAPAPAPRVAPPIRDRDEELARLTDPSIRRAVIRKRAGAPSAAFREGLGKREWHALTVAERRAILDRTAPLSSAQ